MTTAALGATIAIDYGTNAEMALVYRGRVYTGSAAAGPALAALPPFPEMLDMPKPVAAIAPSKAVLTDWRPEDKTFYVPDGVAKHFNEAIASRGRPLREEWEATFAGYRETYPGMAAELDAMMMAAAMVLEALISITPYVRRSE